MNLTSTTGAPATTTAAAGSTAESAQIAVMKKARDLQSANAATLLQSLPQPALASSGTLGTNVNTYA
jgi:Putative motility protein